MIENRYDIAFVANLARREKQVQQTYRPVISVHKWFARRPGTLFRSLMLSEYSDIPLREAFYQAGNLTGKNIADPFMGGGTPLLEANRMGANIEGCDINPMAYWIVRQEMESLDIHAYREAANSLRTDLENELGHLYRTQCQICGSSKAHVKYFLWVKTTYCSQCSNPVDLFPGYLIADDTRHPKNVFLCADCGQLTECADKKQPGKCAHCNSMLATDGPAKRSRCICKHCRTEIRYPNGAKEPFKHRLFALEYHCPICKSKHQGRFFKAPDEQDLANVKEAEIKLASLKAQYIPDDVIPAGDETTRLHRWGYNQYSELFNSRQLIGLETSCRLISKQENERIRNALATNLSDLLRYQNMLCRYDTMALKSLDIFSIHGFPVGLVHCESNILGIEYGGGLPMGSGGWLNIIEKYAKAKMYCDNPFEVSHHGTAKGSRKTIIPITGEWIGDAKKGEPSRILNISCADASNRTWQPNSLDGVFTDPPYFGNVQYAELMDFCYVWLRRLIVAKDFNFLPTSTRHAQELTGNDNMCRGLPHFAEGLSRVFSLTASALKQNAPFVFTYHHNDISAYFPLAVAILDAELFCSRVLPCPAEMGASIHIKGTASATVDSIFVCRRRVDYAIPDEQSLGEELDSCIAALKEGGLSATVGDIRCTAYGLVIRQAINALAESWNKTRTVEVKLEEISQWFSKFGGLEALHKMTKERLPLNDAHDHFDHRSFPSLAKERAHDPVSI